MNEFANVVCCFRREFVYLANPIVQPTNNHFVAMGWLCLSGFLPFGQSISDTLEFILQLGLHIEILNDYGNDLHVRASTMQNGLPVALRLTPMAHSALFLSSLKTTLFDRGWAGGALE